MSLHSRSARHTSTPSPSGSTRSRIAASGRLQRRRRRAPPPPSRAGSASKPASRMTIFSARTMCGSSSQTSTRGRSLTAAPPRRPGSERRARARPAARRRSSCPDPGSDSAHTRPPLASTKPLTIASPSPSRCACALSGAAVEGLEDPRRARRAGCPARGRRSGSSAARPLPVRAPTRARRRSSARRSRTGSRTHARAGPRPRARAAGPRRSMNVNRARARIELVGRLAQDLLDRAPLAPRLGRARLQAREIEQLLDERRQPLGLLGDRPPELLTIGARDLALGPAPNRR